MNKAQSARQSQKLILDAMPKPESVDKEIEGINSRLRPDGDLKKGFRSTKDYQRLKDLSRISNRARNLLYDFNLSHEKSLRGLYDQMRHTLIADALEKDMFARNVIDHVENTHDQLTTEHVKDYADHIASRNVEPIPEKLPDTEPQTVDSVKDNFYDDDLVEDLLDAIPSDEIKAEYKEVTDKLNNMDKFKDMTRTITKCLLGGARGE